MPTNPDERHQKPFQKYYTEDIFLDADVDNDGNLSREEWIAYHGTADGFDDRDADGNGLIDGAEFAPNSKIYDVDMMLSPRHTRAPPAAPEEAEDELELLLSPTFSSSPAAARAPWFSGEPNDTAQSFLERSDMNQTKELEQVKRDLEQAKQSLMIAEEIQKKHVAELSEMRNQLNEVEREREMTHQLGQTKGADPACTVAVGQDKHTQLGARFDQLDLNHSNELEVTELQSWFRNFAGQFLKYREVHKGSTLSKEEFIEGIIQDTQGMSDADFQHEWLDRLDEAIASGSKAGAVDESQKASSAVYWAEDLVDLQENELDVALRKVFDSADVNGDGVLQQEEYMKLMKYSGLNFPGGVILQGFVDADTNQDGVQQFEEFLPAVKAMLGTVKFTLLKT